MPHPIHPAIVHFPVACWSLATLSDATIVLLDVDADTLAGTLHVLGLATGLLALFSGLFDITKIDNKDPEVTRVANIHMGAACSTWCLYAACVFFRLDGGLLSETTSLSFILSVAGFVGLTVTGWLGGTLVYEHRVGTLKKL